MIESKTPHQITLSIQSELQLVSLVSASIKGLCSHIDLTEKVSSRIELSVVEAINNVIEHAYLNEPGHLIDTIVTVFPHEKLTIQIMDKGVSMSLSLKELLKEDDDFDPLNPDTWKTSGRGLKLIDKIMDVLTYEVTENNNRLCMTYYIRNSESS